MRFVAVLTAHFHLGMRRCCEAVVERVIEAVVALTAKGGGIIHGNMLLSIKGCQFQGMRVMAEFAADIRLGMSGAVPFVVEGSTRSVMAGAAKVRGRETGPVEAHCTQGMRFMALAAADAVRRMLGRIPLIIHWLFGIIMAGAAQLCVVAYRNILGPIEPGQFKCMCIVA